jgi:hypothetical protein
MHKEGDSSGKHSDHSAEEEEKDVRVERSTKEKVEKPLKVKIPKNKHSFTVIGKRLSILLTISFHSNIFRDHLCC